MSSLRPSIHELSSPRSLLKLSNSSVTLSKTYLSSSCFQRNSFSFPQIFLLLPILLDPSIICPPNYSTWLEMERKRLIKHFSANISTYLALNRSLQWFFYPLARIASILTTFLQHKWLFYPCGQTHRPSNIYAEVRFVFSQTTSDPNVCTHSDTPNTWKRKYNMHITSYYDLIQHKKVEHPFDIVLP